MFVFAFEDAPTHPQETCPGEDAQRESQPPDGEILKREKMRATRPLQIPRQVGRASRLEALFGNALDPLLIEQQSAERIWLENAEGQNGGKSANDEEDENLHPIFGVEFLLAVVGKPADEECERQYQRHRGGIDLRRHAHAQGKTKSDGKIKKRTLENLNHERQVQRDELWIFILIMRLFIDLLFFQWDLRLFPSLPLHDAHSKQ